MMTTLLVAVQSIDLMDGISSIHSDISTKIMNLYTGSGLDTSSTTLLCEHSCYATVKNSCVLSMHIALIVS